jgi:hypothetical protein
MMTIEKTHYTKTLGIVIDIHRHAGNDCGQDIA